MCIRDRLIGVGLVFFNSCELCWGHAHQISRTTIFKLKELSLFLQSLVVQPLRDPWHDPTKLLEKKTFFLDTASILEACCSQTNKTTYLGLGSF